MTKNLNNLESVIIKNIISGLSNYEIAQEIGCTVEEVKNSLKNLFTKYSVKNRVQLVIYALKNHLIKKG